MSTTFASTPGSLYAPAPRWLVGFALGTVSLVVGASLYFGTIGQSGAPIASAATPAGPGGIPSLAIGSDDAALSLKLSGLEPGRAYVARLYAGTPDEPSASSGVLGSIIAAADGTAELQASSVRLASSGALVDLREPLASGEPRFVNVHKEPTRVVVATGTIATR
jgi:hypothetical protein